MDQQPLRKQVGREDPSGDPLARLWRLRQGLVRLGCRPGNAGPFLCRKRAGRPADGD